MKYCTKCKKEKELTEFYKSKSHKDGLMCSCKECANSDNRKRYKESSKVKSQMRNSFLKSRFGISLEKYNDMLYAQDGCCEICGIHHIEFKKALSVDHNHETLEVRGLLCNNCNAGIGFLKDNPELLRAGIEYLEKYEVKYE